MPLVKAQCSNCNGILEVDNGKDAAICPFCGTPYIVENAINNYNISNTNYIQNAYFESDNSEDKLIRRGITQLELQEYTDARDTFQQIIKLYPDNFRGWLGMCILEANDPVEDDDEERYRKNTISTCPPDLVDDLYDAVVFSEKRKEQLLQECDNASERIEALERTKEKKSSKLDDIFKVKMVKYSLVIIGIVVVICSISNRSSILGLLLGLFIGLLMIFISRFIKIKSGKEDKLHDKIDSLEEQIEREKDLLGELNDLYEVVSEKEHSGKTAEYFIELMKK